MPLLTDYELERQANIERNKAFLLSLGIYQAEIAPSHEAEQQKAKALDKAKRAQAVKRKARPSEPIGPNGPRRKSARLMSTAQHDASSDPIDFLSHPTSSSPRRPGAVTLRRLPPPPIPERRIAERRATSEKLDGEEGTEEEEKEEEEERYDSNYRAPEPARDESGTLRFADAPHFTPNMTPEEIFRAGSFGGTAFAEHYSSILSRLLPATDYVEFPSTWFSSLPISTYLCSPTYNPTINRYRVKAGQTLGDWEKAGWVHTQDPRGWMQWYCRFYLGRRTRDDKRQIKRWLGVCGPAGRFKRGLVKKIAQKGGEWDDETISPIVRQTLQHWAYRLNEEDYRAYL